MIGVKKRKACLKFFFLFSMKIKIYEMGKGAFHSVTDKKNLIDIALVFYLIYTTFLPM